MPRNVYLEELNQQIAATEREIENLYRNARLQELQRGKEARVQAATYRATARRLQEDLAARKARRDEERAARPGLVAS